MFGWSQDWNTLLPLRKSLSTLHLQLCRLLKQYVPCIVLDIELIDKNVNKELGIFIDGSVQRFSFCQSKAFKPNKQTTWNRSRLHGIAWSSGKLDYDKLFAVFYDIKVMNAEVFPEEIEKCRLLTRLLGENVENLEGYGCPKIQDLVKTDSLWSCSSYPFRHKTRLHCAERKAKETGLFIICKFCMCLMYLCLLLI